MPPEDLLSSKTLCEHGITGKFPCQFYAAVQQRRRPILQSKPKWIGSAPFLPKNNNKQTACLEKTDPFDRFCNFFPTELRISFSANPFFTSWSHGRQYPQWCFH